MATRHRAPRPIPWQFDDGIRGAITMGAVTVVVIVVYLVRGLRGEDLADVTVAAVMCTGVAVTYLAYVIWTHRLFARHDHADTLRIAALQHRKGVSLGSRLIGFGSSEDWAVSAGGIALLGAFGATIFGSTTGGIVLVIVALFTSASAWVTVVYAFALRYLRLHAAGESFEFDFEGEPRFSDFVTLSAMISAAGAIPGAMARTRAGLAVVRTHTVIAFVFNALVIAMVVSLLGTVVASVGR